MRSPRVMPRPWMLCLVSLLVISGVGSVSAEYKIATIDINRVINETAESKTLKAEIDGKVLAAKKKVEAKKQALKTLEEKLKANRVSEDSKEAESYREQAKELSRLVKDSDEEIRKEILKSNKILTEKALKLVNDYATKNDLSLVLEKSEQPRGPVLFGNPGADVTDEVLKTIK
ncbi:MAG: OmpH family outer membrane protein [Oligoflexia bacterium]|nr:OmpH family outer membrane protein [Oligoflexia bacterium]